MARPRKNPEDPKWDTKPSNQKPDEWILLFSSAFGGLVSRGGLSMEQTIKTAAEYADKAYTAITSPLK